ncbi:MAG: hypothetical protein O7C62_03650 [Rickettsia endosymbiont of Ixodes persulcatus]|nr:hypothetical protein [Rickettsia endosymbiont of Ixodes persulcatus]
MNNNNNKNNNNNNNGLFIFSDATKYDSGLPKPELACVAKPPVEKL